MKSYSETLAGMARQPRTWLVTGAAGFIGSNLLETLLQHDQNVIALDNFATGKRENLWDVRRCVGAERWSRLRFMEGDIRSPETCHAACADVDIVLHQAALGSVVRSMECPPDTHAANIDGFLNMLLAARDAGVKRFVYASSSSTYGDIPSLPKVEDEIGRLLSPYALSKYVNELYADVFARCYGTESIGLRYFNVFGQRQDPDSPYAAVIPKWIAAFLRDEPVYINGDGTTSRDFCFIDNVVQANILAATVEQPEAVNQVYNVAVGSQTTLDELFVLLRRMLVAFHPAARDQEPEYRDFRKGDVLHSLADIGKAGRLLGYAPEWDIERGLERALAWYVPALAPAATRPQPDLQAV